MAEEKEKVVDAEVVDNVENSAAEEQASEAEVVDVVDGEFAQEKAVTIEDLPLEPVSEEEESEFLDDSSEKKAREKKEAAALEAKKKEEEAQKEAEKKAEETARSLHLSAEEEGGETPVFIAPHDKCEFEYDDPNLASIEKARLEWVKSYRTGSIIKISISMVCLAAIIVGWVVPTTVMGANAGKVPLYTALGCAGGALLIMVLTSFLIKRRNKGVIADYFRAFYAGFDNYVFDGLDVDNRKGTVDDKITKEEFEAGKVFSNTHSVGSRDSLTFTYKRVDCALCDAAGQELRDNKTLGTSFVGKYLRAHSHTPVSDDGVIIYLKGNDRAIPPTSLLRRNPAIEESRFNVYGSLKDIDAIPEEAMERIKAVRTDKLLVDVTVSIQKGRTYFYLGYEDTLMVLPNKEHFNPNYLIAYKKQLTEFLEIATLL